MTAAPIPLLAPVTMKTLGDAIFARRCHGLGGLNGGKLRDAVIFLIAIAGGSGNVETVVSSVAGGYYTPVLAEL